MMNKKNLTGIIIALVFLTGIMYLGYNPHPEWPEIEKEHNPWTRWWWMGNTVNEQDLTRQMELYKEANLGGVEITPIYGVAGYEDQFIDYLSPEWMKMLNHTLAEGSRLDLGIDMATGTGWPFGGPMVEEDEASRRLYYKTYQLEGGQQISENISYEQEPYLRAIRNTIYEIHGFLKAEGEEPEGTSDQPLRNPESEPLTISDIQQPLSANKNLQELALEQVRFEKTLPLAALMAYSNKGEILDLTAQVDENGTLDWDAPQGDWTLYAVFSGWHGKTVERAAPGGEGFVLDHFSNKPIQSYLAVFDSSFAGNDISGLRSFFNDSYEVDDAEGEANWTPEFFAEFEERRGYDLREHLPSLLEENDTEKGRRVLTDYRETISDLLLNKFTHRWDDWAEENGAMIRNQAHGSPANILDLYAASDIPETEGTDIIRAKMASSAANVTGKKLVSSESATWLDEHFLSSLADVKDAVDRFFISGINHIFYHGTAYSPSGEEWPGWLFYAAVHFNERNPFWDHFSDFNSYVTRVQSFLQSGSPDNDILMYYPIHDQWAEPGYGLLRHFDGGMDESLDGTYLKEGSEFMIKNGFSYDFVSDRQLEEVVQNSGALETGGVSYKTVVIPHSRFIPLETFSKLVDLADKGATVIAFGGLPEDVTGFNNLEDRQQQFIELVSKLNFNSTEQSGIEEAVVGEGRIIRGSELSELGILLEYAGVQRETMVDQGLEFVRRSHDSGHVYFITNRGEKAVDGWIPLAGEMRSAAIFDPMQEEAGFADIRSGQEGGSEIYLQLARGESCIVKTFDSGSVEPTYKYFEQSGEPLSIEGTWTLEFINGGPELPQQVETDSLESWTLFGGESYRNFSGTGRYSISFEKPSGKVDGWLLNLGEVRQSALVILNGEELGTLIGPEYEVFISVESLQENNELEIQVANLMANRIAEMERQDIKWKKFYNVNFPARLGQNRNERGLFDASDWEPRPSGLLGPVTLRPVQLMNQEL